MSKEEITDKQPQDTLARLISRGGIFYKVAGSSKKEVVSNIINNLPVSVLSADKRENLLQAVMEREAIISTGIENGIALPHPRTPILREGEPPFITIAFLAQPLDWVAPDNSETHTVFLIVSGSPKQHLNALTKINFLCMIKDFHGLLTSQASGEKIISAIEEAEKGWRK